MKSITDTHVDWPSWHDVVRVLSMEDYNTRVVILGTVLDELERRDAETGLITLCAANGLGTAAIIERV